MSVEPVATKSGDSSQLLAIMIGIFSEYASIHKVCDSIEIHILKHNLPAEIFIISVECTVKSESESVRVAYDVLIQKISKCRMLSCNIFCRAEIRVHILVGIVGNQRYVL